MNSKKTIKKADVANAKDTVSKFYARFLFESEKEFSMMLSSQWLYQQFVWEMWVKIEAGELS